MLSSLVTGWWSQQYCGACFGCWWGNGAWLLWCTSGPLASPVSLWDHPADAVQAGRLLQVPVFAVEHGLGVWWGVVGCGVLPNASGVPSPDSTSQSLSSLTVQPVGCCWCGSCGCLCWTGGGTGWREWWEQCGDSSQNIIIPSCYLPSEGGAVCRVVLDSVVHGKSTLYIVLVHGVV